MKSFFLFFSFSILWLNGNAQQWLWAYPIVSNGGSWVMNIEADPQKNPVFTGTCNPYSSAFLGTNGTISKTQLRSFVAKYDVAGNILWVGGGWQDAIVRSSSIDAHGNIYLTGNYRGQAWFGIGKDTVNAPAAVTDDYFLAKLDNDGKGLFLEAGGDSCYDEGTSIVSFPSDESVFFWVDETYCNFASASYKNFEKRDKNGTVAWSLPLPSSFQYSYFVPKEITVTKDHGFLLSDYWHWSDSDLCFPGINDSLCLSPPEPSGIGDVFLIKYLLDGNPQWGKRIHGSNYQFEQEITVDSSNNIILALSGLDTTYYDSIALKPKGSRTTYIIKADPAGNLINYLSFEASYPPSFNILDLNTDEQGNVYIMVTTDSDVVIGTDSLHFDLQPYGRALAIIKVDKDLKYIWSQYATGGSNDGGSMCITDSVIYLSIHHNDTVKFHGGSYIFSAPSSPSHDGLIAAMKNSPVPLSIQENGSSLFFNIFPNPSRGVFNLSFSEPQVELKISVFNLMGCQVFEKKCSSGLIQYFDLSSHPKGIYLLQASSGKGTVTKKIALE